MNKENGSRSFPVIDPSVPAETAPVSEQDPSEDEAFMLDWRKCLINAFLVWQVFAISVWLLPVSSLQMSLAAVVRPYMMLTGCWQAWTMFSPQPSNTDMYLKAVIVYQDGSSRGWDFPRMNQLDLWTRYREERWRKAVENMEGDQARGYWPYLARYAALQNDPQPDLNPPVKVRLVRHFRLIPPPGVPIPPFTDYEFYQQSLTPALMRGDTLILPPPLKVTPGAPAKAAMHPA